MQLRPYKKKSPLNSVYEYATRQENLMYSEYLTSLNSETIKKAEIYQFINNLFK